MVETRQTLTGLTHWEIALEALALPAAEEPAAPDPEPSSPTRHRSHDRRARRWRWLRGCGNIPKADPFPDPEEHGHD